MHEWTVRIEPGESYSKHAKAELAGLVVTIADSEPDSYRSFEVARVAFARHLTKNPDVSFQDALQAEIDKATEACNVINDALDDLERARSEAVEKARDRVSEILGGAAPVADHT